eukprot:CAMPEP_0177774748 /NCGR_PEP_ID=MMETSP0491_2-20121128/13703_1 /TAXON_ID=63592 /ORGANISM="Tetraselmis chuii, Strain PLY429" /LENGTH=118 /DNA_ID=CAMNT_0019293209 /DNA_START=184 /DNA_END=537 /DNA_ORIENTATION=-
MSMAGILSLDEGYDGIVDHIYRAASGVIPTERMLGRHIFGSVRGEVLTVADYVSRRFRPAANNIGREAENSTAEAAPNVVSPTHARSKCFEHALVTRAAEAVEPEGAHTEDSTRVPQV